MPKAPKKKPAAASQFEDHVGANGDVVRALIPPKKTRARPNVVHHPNTLADLKNQIRRLRLAVMPTSKGAWRAETVVDIAIREREEMNRLQPYAGENQTQGMRVVVDTIIAALLHEANRRTEVTNYLGDCGAGLFDGADPIPALMSYAERLANERAAMANEEATNKANAATHQRAAERASADLAAERAAHAETKERLVDALGDVFSAEAQEAEAEQSAAYWKRIAMGEMRMRAQRDARSSP